MDADYALFARIVETGSLSAAARAIGLSPAMVSKRLARLETRLGVQLIHRTTRRLALTPPGGQFYAELSAILRSLRDAEERLTGAAHEPTGVLRMSAPTSLARLHISPRLHMFVERFPRVRLELDLSDTYVDLLAGRFDLAVRIGSSSPASLAAHRLGHNTRLLCAAPSYFDRYGTPASLETLSSHRLLAATGQLPWQLERGTEHRRVDGVSHVRTNSSEVVRELAVTGVGIALRSTWDVASMLEDGRLVHVLPAWSGRRDLAIWALHPVGRAQPAVRAMVRFLKDCFRPPVF